MTQAFTAAGASITTTGEIAITKSVTLTSLSGTLPGTIDEVPGLQVRAGNVLFRNLLIATPVTLMSGANGTTFRNCMLEDVSDTDGLGSGGRTFSDNVFYGDVTLRDDADESTVDRVLYNQFQDSSLRLLEANKAASVRGNEFNMVGSETAITIDRGRGIVLRQNTITFTNPSGPGDKKPSGGSLGSLGGNNFRGFSTAAATAGSAFSIYLANLGVNSTEIVPAQNNLWSTTSPNLTVKDSINQSAKAGWDWDKGVGTVNVGAVQLSGKQQFVQSLYNEFLGRCGTSTEIDAWATKITLGTATRQQASTGIITSNEAYGYHVDGLYRSILQRSADAAGRSGWVSQLRAGASTESVAASLTASNEYFSRLSLMSLETVPLPINGTGATGDAAYVTSLYQKYMERLPTNAEVSSWLAAGPMTSARRLSTAQSILTSSEFRAGLIEDDLYYRMLNRKTPPLSTDVASWNTSGLRR